MRLTVAGTAWPSPTWSRLCPPAEAAPSTAKAQPQQAPPRQAAPPRSTKAPPAAGCTSFDGQSTASAGAAAAGCTSASTSS